MGIIRQLVKETSIRLLLDRRNEHSHQVAAISVDLKEDTMAVLKGFWDLQGSIFGDFDAAPRTRSRRAWSVTGSQSVSSIAGKDVLAPPES